MASHGCRDRAQRSVARLLAGRPGLVTSASGNEGALGSCTKLHRNCVGGGAWRGAMYPEVAAVHCWFPSTIPLRKALPYDFSSINLSNTEPFKKRGAINWGRHCSGDRQFLIQEFRVQS